jgi:hypothetical protein
MTGWIVLWTVKYATDRYQDFNEIIIEYNEAGQSPEEQARELFKNLQKGAFDIDTEEVYSANLCEIKDSTEPHYLNVPIP